MSGGDMLSIMICKSDVQCNFYTVSLSQFLNVAIAATDMS
jgi:hypothetical protein